MTTYLVKLWNIAEGSVTCSEVCADEGETSDNIVLKLTVNNYHITAQSEQYLNAYQKLRDELLKIGYGLRCNGSLINANQSAMMAYVPEIYLVEKGRPALMKDIVHLWDNCEIYTFPTTEEQNVFSRVWRDSLKK